MRIGTAESLGITAVLATDLLLEFQLNAAAPARWQGGILFDGWSHDALTPASASAQSRAGTWSTVGLYGLAAFPVLIDAALVTWLGRGNADGALQLALLDVEALGLAWGISTLVERTVSRARPYTVVCASDPSHARCDGSPNDMNTSFPSGHTTVAFASAALLCVEHARLDIYGKADAVVCPIAATAAAATGVLRIVADKHWASDVLAGAALGTAIGAGVALLHVRGDPAASSPRLGAIGGGESVGLGLRGRF